MKCYPDFAAGDTVAIFMMVAGEETLRFLLLRAHESAQVSAQKTARTWAHEMISRASMATK
jgi:hypothetical protein